MWCCSTASQSKLLKKGYKKLQDEMNIVNVIKDIRRTRIVMESSLLKNPLRRYQVNHVEDNLIDIDSEQGLNQVPKHLKRSVSAKKRERTNNMFYISGNEDVSKLMYFEDELDVNLQQKIIFKDSIPEAFESKRTFERATASYNEESQTD